jgi:hypothetical protein
LSGAGRIRQLSPAAKKSRELLLRDLEDRIALRLNSAPPGRAPVNDKRKDLLILGM